MHSRGEARCWSVGGSPLRGFSVKTAPPRGSLGLGAGTLEQLGAQRGLPSPADWHLLPASFGT